MQKTSPIRRYVLLRHRDHGMPAPRWSIERIAGAQRSGAAPSVTAPSAGTSGSRR